MGGDGKWTSGDGTGKKTTVEIERENEKKEINVEEMTIDKKE